MIPFQAPQLEYYRGYLCPKPGLSLPEPGLSLPEAFWPFQIGLLEQ